MFRNNLHYTVGTYNESPEGTLSTSGPTLLAQTLAWAVQNDIPFHEVLLSLTKKGSVGFFRPLFLLPRSKRWEKCLWSAYADLLRGRPLYVTLRKRFEYFLPEYYLQAVEQAEKQGCLKEVLPVFARRLNFSSENQRHFRQALIFPFLELLVFCALLSFLSAFIFPNFHKIFDDLTNQRSALEYVSSMLFSVSVTWKIIGDIISLYITMYCVSRLFPSLYRKVIMMCGEIIVFIPPFRHYLKETALLDLSSSMASCLETGNDIVNAARFSEKSCNHFWLKRKLRRFISRVKKGENWLEAWRGMNLHQSLGELIIRNAAAAENPAAGFDIICDWLYHKKVRSVKNNALLLTLLFIAFNATVVFFIAFYVFKLLIQIICAL